MKEQVDINAFVEVCLVECFKFEANLRCCWFLAKKETTVSLDKAYTQTLPIQV